MAFFRAFLKREADELVYRNYVAESLRYAPQNKYMESRYIDLVGFDEKPAKETRSGAEVVADVIKHGGLKFKEDDEEGAKNEK